MGDWHDRCLLRCSGLEGRLISPGSLPVRIRGRKYIVVRDLENISSLNPTKVSQLNISSQVTPVVSMI